MEFHLKNFDGPLDLLLHLIAKNKVSISDIPISEILDQYMEILRAAEDTDMDTAGDFIAMAAQLVYIKSRLLLPKPDKEEIEDPRAGLVEMLLEYQRIKEAAPFLKEKEEIGRDIFVKGPEQRGSVPQEYHQSVEDLIRAADAMLYKRQRRVPPPVSAFSGIVGREPVPVAGQIQRILKQFLTHTRLRFARLFDGLSSRSEIVAAFLAVLELSKTNRVLLIGEGENLELTLSEGDTSITFEQST